MLWAAILASILQAKNIISNKLDSHKNKDKAYQSLADIWHGLEWYLVVP